jgi:hypothetical protein
MTLEKMLRDHYEQKVSGSGQMKEDLEAHERAIGEAEGRIKKLVSTFGETDEPAVVTAIKGEIDRLTVEIRSHRECADQLRETLADLPTWEDFIGVFKRAEKIREDYQDSDPPFEVKRYFVEGSFIVYANRKELRLEQTVVPVGSS